MSARAVCVMGADGRMGRALVEALAHANDLRLGAALEQPASPGLGRDAGAALGLATGVAIGADLDGALANCAVAIDFTSPHATLAHLARCRARGIQMVIGTTGLDPSQRAEVAAAAHDVAIVFAPNMSVGVNLAFKLTEIAARVLGEDFDAEVVEAHHRHKVDAPSGTALRLGEVIAAARGRPLDEFGVFAREGHTGERQVGSIGFATVRGGDIVGDHTAMFAGVGERLEVVHKASSRATFAHGALRAARFLQDKSSGLFDMQDVLGLR